MITLKLKHLPLVAALLLVLQAGPRLEAGPVSGVDSTGHPPTQQTPSQKQSSDQQNKSKSATGKAQTIKPRQVKKRISRAETQDRITRLIRFSQKAAAEIRKEIKIAGAQKGKRLPKADVKAALVMADKLDRYALTLRQKEKSLAGDGSNSEAVLQTMTDMSQQLQLQLQDAMNKQQQAMQVLSNIMKNQHDTLKAIIQNMR